MSVNAPQTLSVKRKRGDLPVEALVVEKRLKSDSFSLKRKLDLPENDETKRKKGDSSEGTVVWRLVTSTQTVHGQPAQPSAPVPLETTTRRFHVSRDAGNVVLFEKGMLERGRDATRTKGAGLTQGTGETSVEQPAAHSEQPSTPRKRPGAGAALKSTPAQAAQKARAAGNGISDAVIRQFERFSEEVEKDEVPKRTPRQAPATVVSPSPSKFTPKAPRLRYKDRHPEEAAALARKDPHAMDVDSEGYVYDTYVAEVIMPDADGKLEEPQGNIGYIVLTEEDEEWWYEDDGTDKEFDTDDEDSNAEEYYANDYPEDELSSDDEFDRDPYRHYHDENSELYDLADGSGNEEEEEDESFRQTVPKTRGVFWGMAGEQ